MALIQGSFGGGAPGPANTLSIGAVSTLPAGQPATASITGTSPTQVLSLGIPQGVSGITSIRRKSELVFTGLSLTIPQTTTNLINLLKALTPASGTFAPFFDTTANKLIAFNNNSTLTFKLNIIGSFTDNDITRSMEIDFTGTIGNKLVESRDSAVSGDTLSFATFFSVDTGGNLATNGAPITIKSNGRNFVANTILLIAEQMVPSS